MKAGGFRAPNSFSLRLLALGAGVAGLALVSWTHDAGAVGRTAHREWTLEATSKRDVYDLGLLEAADGSIWSNSHRIARARIEGLGPAGLASDQDGVTLRFKRDAGTIVATGAIHDGRGRGTFEIELDPAYAAELEKRGVGRPTSEQQRHLLHADVPLAFLDDLKSYGYPLADIELLVRCADHGVDQEFVRGLAEAGYRLGEIEPLIHARDHGVDPRYIEALAAAGYGHFTMPELVRARDHGVDPEYIGRLAAAGYTHLPMSELLRARDHGVDSDFIDDLAAAGLKDLDIEELVKARDHGVDGRYLADMRAAGYDRLTLSQAIRARDHGVDGAFAKKFQRQEGRSASLEELIHARDMGG